LVAFYLIKLLISVSLILIIESVFSINNDSAKNFSETYNPIIVLIFGALLIPLIEETVFRLSIIFKPVFLSISMGLLTLYLFSKFLNVGILKIDETIYYRYAISLIVGVYTLYISKKHQVIIIQFWEKNFRWVFYFSAIAFGFAHYSNFDLGLSTLILIPIITLPHTIGGIFFGYIRIKHGFIFALCFHCVNNMISLSLGLLL